MRGAPALKSRDMAPVLAMRSAIDMNTQDSATGHASAAVTQTDPAPKQRVADLQAGEKAFTVALFLVGLFFLVQSIQLWLRVSPPRISSAAALPLFCSLVWTIFSFVGILENIRKTTPLSGVAGGFAQRLKEGLRYTFPKEVLVLLLAIVVYCASLLLHLSFYIGTPLFLWGSMCYLMKKGYVKNILWTAICMAFIVLVFRMLFGVVLP